MAENSKIEWTSHTFNPWRGCTKVSPGCTNCYADTMSKRNPLTLGVWGPNGTRVVASEAMWREPVKWNKAAACNCHARADLNESHLPSCPQSDRPRVFCASLADVFEDWQKPMTSHTGAMAWITPEGRWMCWGEGDRKPNPDVRELTIQDVRRRLFDLIDATPNIDWLLLTKRPENVAAMLPDYTQRTPGMSVTFRGFSVARPNVWLGTSVENQAAADERIPHLLRTPAAVRFLSCEPLLGPVDLSKLPYPSVVKSNIHWVICGGESGPGARPMHPAWAKSLRDQCQAAGVAFFFKQHGEWGPVCVRGGDPTEVIYADGRHVQFTQEAIIAEEKRSGIRHDNSTATAIYRVGKKAAGRLLDGREWNEFPKAGAA